MIRRIITVAAAAAISVAGCGVLPELPEETPSSWLPEPSVSPTDFGYEPVNGLNPGELAAYRIRNFGCTEGGFGSAFALDDHTLVTNKHVIEGHYHLTANAVDGTDIETEGSVVATIGDLAFIRTVEELPYTVTLADDDPEIGDAVTIIGFPNSEELTTTEGQVLAEVEDTLDVAEFVFETDAEVEPGSSGSAVYDDEWQVIGVLYAGDDGGLDHSYFVPLSILTDFLDDESTHEANRSSC